MPPAQPSPPGAVILAGVGAIVGAVPGAFAALFGGFWLLVFVAGVLRLPWSEGGDPGEMLLLPVQVQGSLFAVGLPVLLVMGAVRLFQRRDRLLLVLACVPVTVISGVVLLQALAGATTAWLLLLVLGPALAPVFALAPSVGRWLADRPFLST